MKENVLYRKVSKYQNVILIFFAQCTSLWNWFWHSNYQKSPSLLLKTFFQNPAFFQDLFHLWTPGKWFYGLIHLQKMAVLSSFKWDFEVFNGMSKFLSNFSNIWVQKLNKIILGTLKKSCFFAGFFAFFLCFPKLFTYLSSSVHLQKIKVGGNGLSFPQVPSNPATFDHSDL